MRKIVISLASAMLMLFAFTNAAMASGMSSFQPELPKSLRK